jgi:GNAT superfamily N-acetyltransferase
LEVAKMAVTQRHRGEGLGRVLLQPCIDRARLFGKKRLYLETNNRLKNEVALYRKLGFVDVPRSAWPPSEYARVDEVMELRL